MEAVAKTLYQLNPEGIGHLRRIHSFAAESGVRAQPMSLDETVTGATNRAKNSVKFISHVGMRDPEVFPLIGIGLESGVTLISPHYMLNIAAAAIYIPHLDEVFIGTASGYMYPPRVKSRVVDGMEVADAFVNLGWATDREFRQGIGASGVIGLMPRANYLCEALRNAFLPFERPELGWC